MCFRGLKTPGDNDLASLDKVDRIWDPAKRWAVRMPFACDGQIKEFGRFVWHRERVAAELSIHNDDGWLRLC